MSNRLKVFSPVIIALILITIAVFVTPVFRSEATSTAGKESPTMSRDNLMAYLQWKHIGLPANTIRSSETQRILDYHRWKDAIEYSKAIEARNKDLLMAYLQWKHLEASNVNPKMFEAELLMNYLQWKHNQPATVEPTSDDTERLLKYLEWKHNRESN
jgi:hypothetical protein